MKKLFLVLALACSGLAAQAQGAGAWKISVQPGILYGFEGNTLETAANGGTPASSTELATPFYWGGKLSVDYMVGDMMSVGITSGYFTRTTSTTAGNNDLEEVQNLIPLTGHFTYFLSDYDLKPFIGLEAGVWFSSYEVTERQKVNATPFVISPKVGLSYQVNPTLALDLAVSYTAAFVQETRLDAVGNPGPGTPVATIGSGTQSYLGVNIGLSFAIGGN